MATTEPKWYMDLLAQNIQDNLFSVKSWDVNWMQPTTTLEVDEQTQDAQPVVANWVSHKDMEWLVSDNTANSVSFSPATTCVPTFVDTNDSFITLPSTITAWSYSILDSNSKEIVKINNDGTVMIGEGANLDDAVSHLFWRTLEMYGANNNWVELQHAKDMLKAIRTELGCDDGESILATIRELKLMSAMLTGEPVNRQPVEEIDPLTAYERAMKVL